MNSHSKWLRQAAEEIRAEDHAGWGNTCEQAADEIDKQDARIAVLTDLLDRLAYPDRYPESGYDQWHSGDGPFEQYAESIAEMYRKL